MPAWDELGQQPVQPVERLGAGGDQVVATVRDWSFGGLVEQGFGVAGKAVSCPCGGGLTW